MHKHIVFYSKYRNIQLYTKYTNIHQIYNYIHHTGQTHSYKRNQAGQTHKYLNNLNNPERKTEFVFNV